MKINTNSGVGISSGVNSGIGLQSGQSFATAPTPFNTASGSFASSVGSATGSPGTSNEQWYNDYNYKLMQELMDYNTGSAQTAMNFESNEAEKLRQWQEQMSNTAHQRAVTDLKAAGLNPILAAGAQASTPSGGMASGAMASGQMANSALPGQQVLDRINAASNLIRSITSVFNAVTP